MSTNYKTLCQELFGTTDPEQLRAIAEKYHKKQTRNAGKKKFFTNEELKTARRMWETGMSAEQIAEHYRTSRQVVCKYLSTQPKAGCTLRMTFMHKRTPCTVIDVDFKKQQIYIQNRTNNLFHRAFGVIENPTWKDFECFLEDRCFPQTRGRLKDHLKALSLDSYDPLQIVEKTKGRTAEDQMWIKFQYFNRRDVDRANGQD